MLIIGPLFIEKRSFLRSSLHELVAQQLLLSPVGYHFMEGDPWICFGFEFRQPQKEGNI